MVKTPRRPAIRAVIVLFALVIIAVQCTKPEQDLGIGLQDEDRLLALFGVDTFTVKTYTLSEDSIRTDKFNPALVGAYVDPIFGFAKAEHVSELRLSTNNPSFVAVGTSLSDLVIDSLVLTLSFFSNTTGNLNDAIYGNAGPQFFRVFEITDSIGIDGAYYSNQTLNFNEQDLVLPGHNFVTPNPADSTMVNGSLALPQIRLPLSTALAERIIGLNNGTGITAQEFVSEVNGIYITVDETQFNPYGAGIVYFDTFQQLSRMSLYYRNTALNDTVRYDFFIRNNSGKFNRFQQAHSLGAASLSAQVIQGDIEQGQRDLYIQAMAGTKIKVDLPHIDELKGITDQALNKAVLTLPVRMETIGNYAPPNNFLIFGVRDDGSLFLLPDQLDGDSFVGGFFDAEAGHYRFTITRYLQQVILGTREFNGFQIVSGRAAFSSNRVVLNGPQYPDAASPENNAKLEIIFTKL
jgi:hypothetical protein